MKFQGALIKEQNVTFAIVIVKDEVLDDHARRDEARKSFQPVFPGVPVILMAQDYSGAPEYFGRRDIVDFLANLPLSAIPWQEYTLR